MREKRIGVVGPLPPLRGGISFYNARLVEALAEVAAPIPVGLSRLYPALLFPGRSQTDPEAEGPSAEIRLDCLAPLGWRRVARELAARRPEALLLHYWSPAVAPAFGTLARAFRRRVPGAPVWFLCHNARPHEALPLAATLTGYALRAADGLLVHGDSVRRALEALLARPPRIVVEPHPLNTAFLRWRQPRAEARAARGWGAQTVFLAFGTVRPYKGTALLIEAFLALGPEAPARLVIAGEAYSGRDALRRLLAAPGAAGRIEWIDRYVSDAEAAALFSGADVAVYPYRGGTASGSLRIAQAFGLPQIVSDAGDLASEHGEGQRVVPAGDREALSGALRDFLDETREGEFPRSAPSVDIPQYSEFAGRILQHIFG